MYSCFIIYHLAARHKIIIIIDKFGHEKVAVHKCGSARWVLMASTLLSDEDVDHIIHGMNISWAKGTCETYGVGLMVYHVFCDIHRTTHLCHLPTDTGIYL